MNHSGALDPMNYRFKPFFKLIIAMYLLQTMNHQAEDCRLYSRELMKANCTRLDYIATSTVYQQKFLTYGAVYGVCMYSY